MDITPNFYEDKKKPLYMQLYEYIKNQIKKDKLEPDEQLPSKRKLAQHLQVSMNTVENAYEQLLAEGYVYSRERVGIFVAHIEKLPDNHVKQSIKWKEIEKERPTSRIKYDFNQGYVDLDHFPFSIWKKLTGECLSNDQKELLLRGHPQGEWGLREEISKYLYHSRGVRCEPHQIVIGAGTQLLVSMMCRIMGKDWRISMENPGYHRSREMFLSYGIHVFPISVEDDGIDLKELKKHSSNLVYVTPSHQFPTGKVMSIQKRSQLLEWAFKNNAYIVEDDYDGEFRYRGKPIPSLQGLDSHERVIYLGTFSKSLIPSIRLSYMVLPNHLIEKYKNEFSFEKQTVSRIHQKTVELFMKEGHWERHLNKMRTLYRKKQKTLVRSIEDYFGNEVTIIGEQSGLHLLLQIHLNMSEEELIIKAEKRTVKVYPTSVYYLEAAVNTEPHILLGFGGLSEEEIKEGVRLLYEAWK
ncbi:MocR-like pyridoxine biosynthesis transcription factor PdxR [Bacillus massilinigeriensis]|uniref:MocR-like pyridoxine biosynthesis transcription factor PdxR n=1 Tax=Bacillus massilionigeriensis TaxID=1805475 RepID=UPI00096B294D|nr:PLP-dependent aminotransferase family protein [Bacillus massilionigeriensis]